MKATEQTPITAAQIQRKSASSFFGNTTEQEQPFFAGKETANTGGFFSPATPLSKNSPIQAKLTVGAPNDKYEQEADTMADKVVQRLSQSETIQTKTTPSVSAPIVMKTAAEEDKLQKKEEEKQPEETPELQKSPVSAVGDDEGLQMKCADCETEDKKHVQRKESGETAASPSIESRLSATKGGGNPLSNDTRSGMESAFGADFSGVRVHTGSEAVQMSQDLNAHAFTHGSDVYFNSDKYNPSNTEGSKLLAHELTHTVQQGKNISLKRSGAVPRKTEVPKSATPLNENSEKVANSREQKAVKSGKASNNKLNNDKQSTQKNTVADSQHNTANNKKNAVAQNVKVKKHSAKNETTTQGVNKNNPKGTIAIIDRKKFGASNVKITPSVFRINPNLNVSGVFGQGTQFVLNEIRNKSATHRESFINQVVLKTQSIQDVVASQQQQLIASGITQELQIGQVFSSERAHIIAQVATAKRHILGHANTEKVMLLGSKNTALTQMSTTFSNEQKRVVKLSDTYAKNSVSAATNSATQLQSNVQNATNQATEIGNQKANVRDTDSQVAEAKRETAHKIASDTSSKTTEGMYDAMNALKATGPETALEFRKQGTEASVQLGQGKTHVDTQLVDIFTNTGVGIGVMSNQSAQSLDTLQNQLLTQLSVMENRVINQLKQHIQQKLTDFAHGGEQITTIFRQQADQTLVAGDSQIQQLNQHIGQTQIKEQDAPNVIESLDNDLSTGFSTLNQRLNDSTNVASNSINQKGMEAASSISTTASTITGLVNGFSARVTAQIQQTQQQSVKQLSQTATQAVTGSNMLNSQVAKGISQQIVSIDQNFQKGFVDYNAGLLNQVNQATTKANEPVSTLPSRVDQGQARAAERARRNWFENQLADAWEMFSDPGFWAGLIVGLILTLIFLFLLAGTLLTGGALLAVLVVGFAVIGAVSAAIGSMVGQAMNHSFTGGWDSSRIQWGEVGKAALIGAAAGAVFAVVTYFAMLPAAAGGLGLAATSWAFAGVMSLTAGLVTIVTNVATGQPWDKGLIASMLLAGVLARLARFLPGGRNPKAPPATETNPIRPPVVDTDPVTPRTEPSPLRTEPEQPRPTPIEPEPVSTRRTPGELVRDSEVTPRPGETQEQADARARTAREEIAQRGFCFIAGTLVQTTEGAIPIENLVKGQLVFAKNEDMSIDVYPIVSCSVGLTQTLYHIEVANILILSSTSNHPFFVIGKGWVNAKSLIIGDELLSITEEKVQITGINREWLSLSLPTYNIHVENAHSYFAGDKLSVLVHNGDPNDPKFFERLFWGLGAKGPRQRLPTPIDPSNPNQLPNPGDIDGASSWQTQSQEEVARFMGARASEGAKSNHGAITEAQLTELGLVAVETPGEGAAARAGLKHFSIRPANNTDPNIQLTETEMISIKAKLESIAPTTQAKPKDFGCSA